MSERARRRAIVALAMVALAEFVCVVVGVLVSGLSLAQADATFMIPNLVIGFACTGCGLLITWYRTDNKIGWSLLLAGVCQTMTGAVTPWLVHAIAQDQPQSVQRLLGTLYSAGWPWSVSLFIPLALLYYPDGLLRTPRWIWVVRILFLNAVVQVLAFASTPDATGLSGTFSAAQLYASRSWLALPWPLPDGVQIASNAVLGFGMLAAFAALTARYRRGDERTRRQLLWLLFALMVSVVLLVAERLPGFNEIPIPVALLGGIALIPIAMAVAVLRYQLLDIRLVWSRAITYLLLSAAIVGVYVALVQLSEHVLQQSFGLGTSLGLALTVALVVSPIPVRLQRWVDHRLYGQRDDPVAAVSAVVSQLSSTAHAPRDLLPAICAALRLPYAALYDKSGLVAAHGAESPAVESVSLQFGGEDVGRLVLGVRAGEGRLSSADRLVADLVAAPLSIAMHALALSGDLQQSRQHIITAREEERRRLRHDLHDGLGPVLTGVAFQTDATANLLRTDPSKAEEKLASVRANVAEAIEDVRRIINALRPAALDDIGLVDAVRRLADQLGRTGGRPVSIDVDAPEPLPRLPAAVEVAGYRILGEALNNFVRHSRALHVDVIVSVDRAGDHVPGDGANHLLLTVQERGLAGVGAWQAGVGLVSMSERVGELGGTLEAGPTPEGSRVRARLPLESTG